MYRESFATFEDYCRERWEMSDRRARQMIAASEVVREIGTIVPTAPATESQARPLTKLEHEQQRFSRIEEKLKEDISKKRSDLEAGRTDWKRLDAMTEAEIEANAEADTDNPPWTDDDFEKSVVVNAPKLKRES